MRQRTRNSLNPAGIFDRNIAAKVLGFLNAFSFVFARFVPVGAFALGANPWLAFGTKPRDPFVATATAFVAFLFDRDHCHNDAMILDKDILSREEKLK
jgi:hypothetical protein